MRKVNQQIVYSPSDLSSFHLSTFSSFMDRVWLENKELAQQWGAEKSEDPYLSMLGEQGNEHEEAILKQLIATHGAEQVAQISMKDEKSLEKTLAAMQSGVKVVFQANLMRDDFAGYSDFLLRVEKPSKLGDYSYEVWDAKLSQVARTEHVLQVCAYSWMLEPILGHVPEYVGFYLGRGKTKQLRTAEYYAYFQSIKADFSDYQAQLQVNEEHRPAVHSQKGFGNWQDFADLLIEAQDSLRQIAGIRVTQVNKLMAQGITTLTDLANTKVTSIKGIGTETFTKLKKQAFAQYQSKQNGGGFPYFEYLPEAQGKGFQILPSHHDADVFFDIEGNPLVEGGLEYLWGATLHNNQMNADEPQGKQYPFVDWWAHDAAQEKVLIEAFVDWVYDRWQANPGMHVYHYASYEITALKKLTGRYNTRIDKLDDLLRANVFIDLYRVVTQALIVGTKNYSIKSVEALYGFKHEGEVANGAQSVIDYEKWRRDVIFTQGADTMPEGWQGSKILNEIRDYNIDDCESTLMLVEWLRVEQEKSGISFKQPVKDDKELSEQALKKKEKEDARKDRQQAVKAKYEANESYKNDVVATNLVNLLEFHLREDKPMWWEYFDLKASSQQELEESDKAIASAQVMDKHFDGESLTLQLSFDPEQAYRKDKLSSIELLPLELQSTKVNVLEEPGQLECSFKVEGAVDVPEIVDLIAVPKKLPHETIQERILEIAEGYFDDGTISKIAEQMLLADKPVFNEENCLPVIRAENDDGSKFIESVVKAVSNLNGSVLSIQGPPGTGKTYTANKVITQLIASGKRVGIMSNSHAAIMNLQKKVVESNPELTHAKLGGFGSNMAQYNEKYPELAQLGNLVYRPSSGFTKSQPYESFATVGATVYAFAKTALQEAPLDYLFVDEASQVALANLLAVSEAAENIVLMGDQMQLEQPIQGSHPGVAGCSALEHLLNGHKVIDPLQGVFLSKTYRMHQDICQPISDLVYEGKLGSAESTKTQQVLLASGSSLTKASGIEYVPVKHENNVHSSEEEVKAIQVLIADLLQSEMVDEHGQKRPMTIDDILIVAPYNLQVQLLKQQLGESYRIGTIDKFQGQEAQVVIVSMASSAAEESARGIDFLFNINRLNVAVSRAKALALIVASPQLLKTKASNVEQTQKVAGYLGLVKH
ncbi:TM0106 family RecB-like putative nuclease [Paraferrimonas sp. SM1919]|uniref:TM0106 family RecB-like putative nuclease n=1 Tax=Paraferrimonas sp. SM1919 TaxID=2662263 RepID=UPI0013D1220B|nr:TM0106 family RecB-like putative nuclease [Paraferrimonas sp. SM1919]